MQQYNKELMESYGRHGKGKQRRGRPDEDETQLEVVAAVDDLEDYDVDNCAVNQVTNHFGMKDDVCWTQWLVRVTIRLCFAECMVAWKNGDTA